MKNEYAILSHPLSTEKSVKLMQADNKLVFVVSIKATKPEIREAVEKMFKVKVTKVNTQIMPNGKKKAYVKLSHETPAIDVATQLGLI